MWRTMRFRTFGKPAAACWSPGRKALVRSQHEDGTRDGEAVVFNDLTVGLAHLAGEGAEASSPCRTGPAP